jgi:peptide/nickel transport system substrate-binding protein
VLTLKLRRGVRWSDGKAFTARDVAFTFNMLRTHPTLIFGPDMKRWVRSVRVVDPRTVRLTFTAPYPRFVLDFLAVQVWGSIIIVPEHVWKGKNPATFKNFDLSEGGPVATGPYRLVQASSTRFVYDRDDEWWAARTGFRRLPAPRRLIFIEQGPEDRSAALLRSNQVDGLPKLGLGSFKAAKARNPRVIGWFQKAPFAWVDPCPNFFEFNTTVEPWDDPQLRLAVALTVDKQKMANLMNEGTGFAARFPFPAYGPLNALLNRNADLFRRHPVGTFNPARAASILTSKGYRKSGRFYQDSTGRRLSIEVLMQSPAEGGPAWGIATQLFKQYFEQAGIEMKPRVLSVSAYQDAASLGQFQGRMAWLCGSVTDPYKTLDAFHARRAVPVGERTDYDKGAGRWKNAEYSRLVDRIGNLQPGDRRIGPLFRQALGIFLREVPVFGIQQAIRIVPYNTTYWRNWPTAQNNYIHPPNWWMTTHQVLLRLRPAR